MTKRARVLIVDDSAVVRQVLSDILSSDPDLESWPAAQDPLWLPSASAMRCPTSSRSTSRCRRWTADVLRKLMAQHPFRS